MDAEELLVDGGGEWQIVERVHDLAVEELTVFIITYRTAARQHFTSTSSELTSTFGD